MSRELHDLLHGIVEKEDLIRAWTVEVGPGGSSLRAQTRRSFRRREDALDAARGLLDELVHDSRAEVRAANTGTTAHEQRHAHLWRGVVDVELGSS
jgi:hypothetical protein